VIVLDTHAWIWWVGGSKKLPRRARRRIDERTAGAGLVDVIW
jgi:PIN domain nuclease of toxin-antitoxin system